MVECPTTGCKSEGDPFCPTHTRPYATELAGDLERQGEELAKAREGKWRHIDPEGPLAQEFMRIVRERRNPTIEKVNQLTFREIGVAKLYLKKLRLENLVTTIRSPRGSLCVLEVA